MGLLTDFVWDRYCVSATAFEGMAVSHIEFQPMGRDHESAVTDDIDLLRPILTPKTVLPLFFAIGIVFAPIGGLLLWASAKVWAGVPFYMLLLLVFFCRSLY